jgi:hypothetical protein
MPPSVIELVFKVFKTPWFFNTPVKIEDDETME